MNMAAKRSTLLEQFKHTNSLLQGTKISKAVFSVLCCFVFLIMNYVHGLF
uniref:Uncharacterized protein n=1 Tax=Mus musculus TaxID=10090 RepID=Q3UMC2_MOUSE|nr:unnamed protein product [Mus musculus]